MKPTTWKNNSEYSNFSQHKKDVLIASVERVRQAKKAIIAAYKSEYGCCICGEKDSIVLEFHHKDNDSKNPVLKRRHGNRSLWTLGWTDMFKEIEKCDVMCANCHRRHTSICRGVV